MCNIEEDKVLQFEIDAIAYIFYLDAIVCGVLSSSTQKLNRLFELRASLQQKKESLRRFEGSNAITKKLKEDIFLFEQCLNELHWQVPCDIDEIKDVEADLNVSKRMLHRLEGTAEMKNLALEMEIEQEHLVLLVRTFGTFEYEVKEEYTDNHVVTKHSKIGHMFDEEMANGGNFCYVEMHEVATCSFQGMSNKVQSYKLNEDKDTTIGAHEEVNDRKEEPNHEDIDKDQKVEVDDDKLLLEKKDGDKDPIIEDPKVDTGGNKVLKEEDPKVDTSVSKEPLEECLPLDDAVHKAQFLRDKDPLIGVDVNEHTPSDDDAPLAKMFWLKAWWLDEPTVIERNPPEDIPASKGRMIILDVNGVVLKGWSRLPKDEWERKHALQGIRVNNFCFVKFRLGAHNFLEALAA
ncbi:hypothetical protein L7F22_018387 [Adiantum nelumboides]|nr:hypothetical protein [Adiantum nelumboides]